MRQTFSAGGVVINKKGEIMVVNQHGSSWSLPKGHIEQDEEPLSAAIREIYEESGVSDLTYIKDLGTYSRYRIGQDGSEDKTDLKTITMFLFTTNDERVTLCPIDKENPEARWVKKDDVASMLTHVKDKEFFESVLSDASLT